MTSNVISLSLKLFFVLVFGLPIIIGRLQTLYGWKVLEFDTPPGYPENPNYQKKTVFITGIQFFKNKIIIATPRFSPGIPASLSWIPRGDDTSPKLKAYPDWSWHERSVLGQRNCHGITSAFRMNVDNCGNLWVVDAGKIFGSSKSICPPSILVFNPRNNQFIKRIILPPHVVRENMLIVNIALLLEASDHKCQRVKAYIADEEGPSLIVYDSGTGHFKRFTDPSMHPNPNYEYFNYFGHTIHMTDGIFGLAIDQMKRELYYKVLAGTATVKVKLEELEKAQKGHFPAIYLRNSSSQAIGIAFGLRERVLVYSNIADADLVSFTEERGESLLAYSPESLQYITDMKTYSLNSLVMVNARFQNYFSDTVDPSKINLKILKYDEGG